MPRRRVRIIVAVLGAIIGGIFGLGYSFGRTKRMDYSFLAASAPLAHHVPQYEGGLSLRFAMVHDVIHERFPRHGSEYYTERNRITLKKLEALQPEDPLRFTLMDDLGAGMDRLGRSDEAVQILRDKLAAQRNEGLQGRELYTTLANLGTFLIHDSFADALAGELGAQQRFREGVAFIRQSVEVNPEAHFGRERWQAAIAEFLLAAMDAPELLTTYDCLGNALALDVEQILDRESNWGETGYGRATDAYFSQGKAQYDLPAFFETGVDPADPKRWSEFKEIRQHITKVGAEQSWKDVDVPSHRNPAPFDEPMLGIIGMWRQGGGANPHFALAIAETMLRCGQRYIAWAAYERAATMADRFWPDPEVQSALKTHCLQRQEQIVAGLTDEASMESLREQFEAELAYGKAYQADYQAYEVAKTSDGAPLMSDGFYDDFHAGRKPIATPPGPEEFFVFVPRRSKQEFSNSYVHACGVLGAAIGALSMLGLVIGVHALMNLMKNNG